jgi:hypothetical protein
MPLIRHLREAGTGGEYMSAVTLITLGLATVFDPHAQSSLVLFLLSLKFPGLWLTLVFLLGAVHLIALSVWPRFWWIVVRKFCSVCGLIPWLVITWQVHRAGNIGATIWLGQIVLYLALAITRPKWTYVVPAP